jgi:hypothetical protein
MLEALFDSHANVDAKLLTVLDDPVKDGIYVDVDADVNVDVVD